VFKVQPDRFDHFHGRPLHSNDTISINGSPRSNGEATTGHTGRISCPTSGTYTYRWHGLAGCGDTPQFLSATPRPSRCCRSNGTNLSDTRNPTATFQNPQVHAAILALAHSFIVQNYEEGAQLGTITVNGVITQKWRGPGGTGYLKSYGYDSRPQVRLAAVRHGPVPGAVPRQPVGRGPEPDRPARLTPRRGIASAGCCAT
jgi:hypothetical protein